MDSPSSPPRDSQGSVTLLSYNIHKGIGGRDRRYRLERTVNVIQDAAPDVVCLQEVDRNVRRSHFDDQPHLLSELLDLPHTMYQLNVHLKHGGYGNLLLSRWPIVEHHQLSLRYSWKKNRGVQLAVIQSPHGKFVVAHTHLGLAEKERHWQVKHLLEHHLLRPLRHLPTMLVGDTNDWRNTLCNGCLKTHGFALATHPLSKFRSFPAWMPLGSLDKFFHNPALVVHDAHLIRSKLAKDASDHLPLCLKFGLQNGHS
jgi:endonuclease/exonuclease/phosphatase family metal-dependent hydrolase